MDRALFDIIHCSHINAVVKTEGISSAAALSSTRITPCFTMMNASIYRNLTFVVLKSCTLSHFGLVFIESAESEVEIQSFIISNIFTIFIYNRYFSDTG